MPSLSREPSCLQDRTQAFVMINVNESFCFSLGHHCILMCSSLPVVFNCFSYLLKGPPGFHVLVHVRKLRQVSSPPRLLLGALFGGTPVQRFFFEVVWYDHSTVFILEELLCKCPWILAAKINAARNSRIKRNVRLGL